VTLILFTAHARNTLADELTRQGHEVYEALTISEVLALAEQQRNAQIIIAAEVETKRAKVIQEHYATLHLQRNATAADVVWELELLSPRSTVAH
jgi:hypothetical protein